MVSKSVICCRRKTSQASVTTRLITVNVEDFREMFCGCKGLSKIDLSAFDIGNAARTDAMFSQCGSLTAIYVGDGWLMENVTYSERMFLDCNVLRGGWHRIRSKSH